MIDWLEQMSPLERDLLLVALFLMLLAVFGMLAYVTIRIGKSSNLMPRLHNLAAIDRAERKISHEQLLAAIKTESASLHTEIMYVRRQCAPEATIRLSAPVADLASRLDRTTQQPRKVLQ